MRDWVREHVLLAKIAVLCFLIGIVGFFCIYPLAFLYLAAVIAVVALALLAWFIASMLIEEVFLHETMDI